MTDAATARRSTGTPIATTSTTDAFKTAFRGHPAGVALITSMAPDGPVGLTASSVASVSAEPPAISFSVTRATGSAGGLLAAESMLVHFLGAQHVDVARAFARSGQPRFTPEQGWSHLETGEPWLSDAPAALRCRTLHVVQVGGSSLVVTEVLDVFLGEEAPSLLYRDRGFIRLDHGVAEL
ncbi:flavin reductase family protein [Agromyces laixinhei]|uniref:flavin reductase family protein n=1 Tax=Agromyces laixinhei TaxID=2585717 RepID=UPI0012ECD234|nr:flavin reductase family protein [Agromyces laixinhei]